MDEAVAQLLSYGGLGILVLGEGVAIVTLWKALDRSREREKATDEKSREREQKALEARTADAQTMTATLLQQLREGNNASNALAQATCDLTDEIRRAMERFERNERSQR